MELELDPTELELDHDMIDVSVIIATWNRARRLAITLDALAGCRLPPGLRWELVLVANACTDRTGEVAASFADRLPLVHLEEPRPGKSSALNTGLAVARGELIVFTDDDTRPCQDWLAVYWSAFRESGGRHYFGGPLRSEFEDGFEPDAEFLQAVNASVRGFDLGPARLELPPTRCFLGANWACPIAVLRHAGEFDPAIGLNFALGRRRVGEEIHVMERLAELGIRALYLPEAWVAHFVPRANCTIQYSGKHLRAAGRASLDLRMTLPSLARLPWLKAWLGEQKWTVAAVCRLGLALGWLAARWATARLAGGKAYQEYVALQFCLGRMQGYLDAMIRRARKRGRQSAASRL